jgi:hypothetical protein
MMALQAGLARMFPIRPDLQLQIRCLRIAMTINDKYNTTQDNFQLNVYVDYNVQLRSPCLTRSLTMSVNKVYDIKPASVGNMMPE